jgi:hypothetical protein
MTISTKYTRADERWSISRKHSVLARRLRKRGHVLRWHCDTEGRIISREIFVPHRAGRAVA